MNEMKLSKRLHAVATNIPKGSTFADIGSDHAYLPCFTCIEGITSYAIAGEVNEGPYQSAVAQVLKSNLADKVSVRKGNGLEILKVGEVDCITIAGMGGQLITQILDEGKDKLEGVNMLILQPNVGAIHIREWFLNNDWQLIKEEIIEEDKKIYEILVAQRGNPDVPYSTNRFSSLLLGPYLKEEKSESFIKKWNAELQQWRNVLQQLEQAAASEEVEERKIKIKEKIKLVEEVLF